MTTKIHIHHHHHERGHCDSPTVQRTLDALTAKGDAMALDLASITAAVATLQAAESAESAKLDALIALTNHLIELVRGLPQGNTADQLAINALADQIQAANAASTADAAKIDAAVAADQPPADPTPTP